MANILQWNLNGLRPQYEFLQKIISTENTDIICLQETNLKSDQNIKIKNFTSYNKNRTDCLIASGGVSVLVKNNLYSYENKLTTTLEAVATTILINNKT